MIDKLNNIIKTKDEEIKKMEREKQDVDLANQLFTDASNEQIESLSNEIKIFKENNEKLANENKSLKENLEGKNGEIETKYKEFDEVKSNLNKIIEELSQENKKLKLDIFKKNAEIEDFKNSSNNKENLQEKEKEKINETNKKELDTSKNNEINSNENIKKIEELKEEIKKLSQSKTIEISQLKLEATKYKIDIKKLNNQIEELKKGKEVSNKSNQEDMNILKINDVLNESSNNDIIELKNKNREYEDQINKMKAKIEEYKKADKGKNELEHKKLDELQKQNTKLYNILQEAQKKIKKANSFVEKAKKYQSCVSLVSKIINLLKPENEEQANAIVELKNLIKENINENSIKK